MESQIIEVFTNVDFWVKLVILVVSGYVYRIVRQVEKDIERLYDKSREREKESEENNKFIAEHLGWHKGRGGVL